MQLRAENLRKLAAEPYDVLVVGGGINGAVSAAALAARGVRVALIDRGDFACETSQASSNLVWGGIKYLESGELGLVRQLCRARNRLMRSYPSSVREIRFLTCIARGFRRSRFVVFMGAILYWIMGLFFTRPPRLLSKSDITRHQPQVDVATLEGGLEYSDAYLKDNDARFVFGFVRAALEHGASVANYVEAAAAERADGRWHCRAVDRRTGRDFQIVAKVLVNACGPWADELNEAHGIRTRYRHLFSKGVHLIVRRLVPEERVVAFFADDGRLFFVLPMGRQSSIGTTDTRVTQLPAVVTDADRSFILDNVNRRLRLAQPLTRADIIAERCGVRPLVVAQSDGAHAGEDWTSLSRKHVIELDRESDRVSVFGGKLTDCVNVGEEICMAVTRLGVSIPRRDAAWYGEPKAAERERFEARARALSLDALAPPDPSESLTERFWRRYGTRAHELLDVMAEDPGAAAALIEGSEYLVCELTIAARDEMVTTLDDFLRRRTALALTLRREQLAASPGVRRACEVLFGGAAQQHLQEYFGDESAERMQPSSQGMS